MPREPLSSVKRDRKTRCRVAMSAWPARRIEADAVALFDDPKFAKVREQIFVVGNVDQPLVEDFQSRLRHALQVRWHELNGFRWDAELGQPLA